MSEEKIIELWKEGYSIEQITEKSVMVQKNKGTDGETKARHYVKNLVENTILKYQSNK